MNNRLYKGHCFLGFGAGCLALAVLLGISMHTTATRAPSFRLGAKYALDLGMPIVSENDFSAEAHLLFSNDTNRTMRIVTIQKPCTCERIIVEPEKEIPPKSDVKIYLYHPDTTEGRGGYFSNTLVFKINDGKQEGMIPVRFSGFVQRLWYLSESQVTWTSSDAGAKTLFLCLRRNVIQNNQPVALTVDSVEVSKTSPSAQVKVKPIDRLPENIHIMQPKKIPGNKGFLKSGQSTATEQFLETLGERAYTSLSDSREWAFFEIQMEPRQTESSFDDTVLLRAQSVEIPISVGMKVSPAFLVAPSSIGLLTKDAVAQVSLHAAGNNRAGLEILSAKADGINGATFRILKISDSRSTVEVSIDTAKAPSDVIEGGIHLATNLGPITIPCYVHRVEKGVDRPAN